MGAAAGCSGGPGGVLAALRRMRVLDGAQRQLRFDEFGDFTALTHLTKVNDGRCTAVTA